MLLGLMLASCQSSPAAPSTAPAARHYQDVTTHTPESVRVGRRLDWANKPRLYRSYPGAESVALPLPRVLQQPLLASLTGLDDGARAAPPLDLELLGTLLFLTGGVTGRRPSGGDLRATAAAGALYPNELYAVTAALPGLSAGVYHYDPKGARLTRLRAGDWRAALARAADDPAVRGAPATVVLTGILWRSAWKYRERAYRHLYWDGGMMLAHLLAAATAAGLPARAFAGFVDADVDRLLGVDGRREGTIAMVRLGVGAAPPPEGTTVEPSPLPFRPTALSKNPIDYPEALRYHAASKLGDVAVVRALRRGRLPRAAPTPRAQQIVPLPPPANAQPGATVDAVVRRRRSTRHFARRPLTAADLAAVLAIPAGRVQLDFVPLDGSLIETYVIVHAVTGVPPGAYYYRRAERQLERLAGGNLRNQARFLCLNQPLAGDASAVIFYLADLEQIGRTFGERGYRLAELEAGVRAGRAYLVAYALGRGPTRRGATGLTFFDHEVTRFFSPHAAGLEPLLVVAVGVPAKRGRDASKRRPIQP